MSEENLDKGTDAEESAPYVHPTGLIVEELSRWAVYGDGTWIATVSYGKDAEGGYRAEVESEDAGVIDFIHYYIDDPLNGHPVYVHGRGFQQGPYTSDPEHFELAMIHMGHHFPSFDTQRLPD